MRHRHRLRAVIQLRKQRGVTLLEALAALMILTFVVVGAATLTDSYSANLRTTVVGEQTNAFGVALQKYVSDNSAAIAAQATATTPVLIQVSTLSAANYVSGGFSATNSYGQTICGLVLQPTAGQLNAVVVTEGGTVINDVDLGNVAASIGAAGGGVYSTAPGTLQGTMGGWSFAAGNFANANASGFHCNGAAGAVTFAAGHPVMALWFTGFNTTSGVLYRNAVPGQPQLNQMNTPIVMSSLQTAGTACASVGAIAQNATQTSLVMCGSNNLWNTVGNAVAGISSGGVCTTAGQLGSDANNVAYVCNGSYWVPSLVSANYSTLSPTGCAVNNQIAVSVQTQEALVCRNNFWVKFASLVPSNKTQVVVQANNFVADPACDWGGHVWGWIETVNAGMDLSVTPPREIAKLAATHVSAPSSGWNITIQLVDTSNATFDASYLNMSEIFHYGCDY